MTQNPQKLADAIMRLKVLDPLPEAQSSPAAVQLWDECKTGFQPQQPRRQRPERIILQAIRKWLHSRGLPAIHIEPGDPRKVGYHAPAGYPDLHTIVVSKYIGIECKAPQGRQSPHQKHWQNVIEKAQGIYIIARSVDDVREVIENLITKEG